MYYSLLLEKLNNPTDAVRVVRESRSVEGAKSVAQYFTRIGDFASAIQFLVLSKCHNAAYEIAQKHRKMEVYANVIGMCLCAFIYIYICVCADGLNEDIYESLPYRPWSRN